ncbi:MAG: penicillin acylase family protein [Phycisphaerales bacterium]|nr:MAG: penicillin acylase family protein [Phycisphaerales bacterium]
MTGVLVVGPVLAGVGLVVGLSSCASVPPIGMSAAPAERVRELPNGEYDLRGEATLWFDEYQHPFIEASHDEDVPYLMGVVHAHQRMGQMELMRHLSQGRLAELFGPPAVFLDASIRAIGLTTAVPEIEKTMDPETRAWAQRYVEGINDYRRRFATAPIELRIIGLSGTEDWTVADVLAIGRLGSADVSLALWYSMAALRDRPGFEEYSARLRGFHDAGRASFGPMDATPLDAIMGVSRVGSNAFAVAGSRTASGAGMLASDPHVGMQIPPLWSVIGYSSPGGSAVGFSIPGVPAIVIGRNENIAWGGTNMLGLSSAMYDVSSLPEEEFTTRTETIRVRWWNDREITITESPFGPVVSESPLFRSLNLPKTALKWRGHEPSDELTAFLKVMRASDFEEFRTAWESYAVSGQNFLYADKAGNIGQVLAMSFSPAAGRIAENGLFADPFNPDHAWNGEILSTELPHAINPDMGFLVSANNTPVRTSPRVSVSGNANDRFDRISDRLWNGRSITLDELADIQLDTYSEASHKAAQQLLTLIRKMPSEGRLDAQRTRLVDAMEAWDGWYRAESSGAAAYQLVLHHIIEMVYEPRYGPEITQHLRRSVAVHDWVAEDAEDGYIDDSVMTRALVRASRDMRDGMVWGDMHRFVMGHPMRRLPLVGGQFRFGDYPIDGSSSTVLKSAHSITNKVHETTFGANARFVTDLADEDENYFVMVGGQDGWLGSENATDQWPLFREGRLVRVPMRVESVRESFPHKVELRPRAASGERGDR